MAKALKILGTLFIIVYLIGAIFVVVEYGTIEVPTASSYYSYIIETKTEVNPVAWGVFIGLVLQGTITFCIAYGLAGIIDNGNRVESVLIERFKIDKPNKINDETVESELIGKAEDNKIQKSVGNNEFCEGCQWQSCEECEELSQYQ